MLHQVPLSVETDYQGCQNCHEILVVTRPEVILGIHEAYFEAGADVVETDSFGGARLALADNHLEDRAYELNYKAARVAREAADRFSTGARPRFVAGSMGLTPKDISTLHSATFEQFRAGSREGPFRCRGWPSGRMPPRRR